MNVGSFREVRVVLRPSALGAFAGDRVERSRLLVALLEMLLLVIAEDALVPHRELDALARLGAAVDEVADEDDAVVVR